MLVIAAGIRPNVGLAQRAGLTVERAIVVDDHMRSIDDDDVYVVGECAQHRGQVYGLVAPLWEQATVLADHLTGADTQRGLSRLPDRHEAQGGRRRRRLDGRQGARASLTTSSCSTPNPGTACTRRWSIRDGKLVGATLLGDVSQGVVPDAGLRQRAAAARRAGGADVRHRHARGRRSASPSWPTTPRCATATACPRARWWPACRAARRRSSGVMAKTKAGQGLRVLQGTRRPDRRVGRRRRGERGSVGVVVRARHPLRQADVDAPHPGARTAFGVLGVRRPGAGRPGGCRFEDGAGVAAGDDVGRRVRRRARRPVHQRPRARQHPARRHLLGGAADEGRRHRRRRSCAGSPTSPRSTRSR